MSGGGGRPPAAEAVCFDFGDTLWHFPDPTPARAIAAETVRRLRPLFKAWGAVPSEETIMRLGERIRADHRAAERAADREDHRSPDYIAITGRCAAAEGFDLSVEQAEALWLRWNLGGPFLGRRILPDTLETLAGLRARGLKVGAITNRALGGEAFADELREHGLLEHFDVVTVSADIGWRKLHPAAYAHALAELNVPPERAVMVGDSLSADVAGASAAGMTTVWMRGVVAPGATPAAGDPSPHYAIDAPAELLRLPMLDG